ncbi:hypothetical protein [Bacillus anthracis]|uniref:hypothetical protein n=1 Tax=Bacillus cereus group TaxID=86661 RepID=UPI002DBC515C|nr:hypothetical protein [Bacillus anthracis]MEB9907848.1 hypothetical protein [Bacillus anthracis]MEC1955811.1 hypothetical protein [Bacillus anthracis]
MLLAGLRTDLDGFHDSEIHTLIRAGEIRIDIALRMLLPKYMENMKVTSNPIFPSEDLEHLKDILHKRGKHRFTVSFFSTFMILISIKNTNKKMYISSEDVHFFV